MALLGNLTGSAPFFQDAVGFYNNVATQSLRLDSASNAYLTKTFSSDGDGSGATCTLSFWIKRSKISNTSHWVITAGAGAPSFLFGFNTSDELQMTQDLGNPSYTVTSRKFRDVSSYYHVLLRIDTSESANADKYKIYVNGELQATTISGTVTDSLFGANVVHNIGRYPNDVGVVDGYLSEFNFVDGSALDPTSFGEFKNGVWIAKRYTGSYGTNGFRLQFNQTGTGTASSSTIGADTSGNDNHFSSSGIVASDCNMPDSPENNFATLNPLQIGQSNWTLSEGNLKGISSTSVSGGGGVLSTMGVSSGKWYWECLLQNLNSDASEIGIANTKSIRTDVTLGRTSDSYAYLNNGNKFSNNSSSSYGATYTTGDIIGVALDLDGATLTFYKNNATQGTAFSSLPSGHYVMGVSEGSTGNQQTQILNFGQDSSFAGNETAQGNTDANGIGDFYYSPPSGYLALCTSNLPEPTISPNADEQADDYFNTVLYTGNGSTQSITGVGFQPDWVWIKQRNAAENHFITDVIRGAGIHLRSDQALAENDDSATFTSFDSDGFSLTGTGPAEPQINDANDTYVSWNWKAGGTAVSNTDGSITSSVSANTDAGFSIVTYSGTGSSATVGHGLGVSPNVIIVKNRIDASDWFVYHSANTSAPETDVLQLNLTDATVDFNTAWNDTLPTSSVFTVGTSNASNGSSDTMVAYCFAEVEGYSKFGSYTGNGSTDGTFVYTGFRPAWVMVKATSQADHWNILDVKRDTFNVMDTRLLANNSTGEQTSSSYNVDFTSNGFKFRTSDVGWNGNNVSYIYMSFAENPFKYSLGR